MKEDHHGEIYRTHKAMETVSSHVQLYRSRAGQDRTWQGRGRAEHSRVEQNGTEQSRAEQSRAV